MKFMDNIFDATFSNMLMNDLGAKKFEELSTAPDNGDILDFDAPEHAI